VITGFFFPYLPVAFQQTYGSAVTHLRGIRHGVRHDPNVREEQSSLFNWRKRKKGGLAAWSHKFVCLSSSEADRVPTSHSEKLLLEDDGLWEKVVTVPDMDCDPEILILGTFSCQFIGWWWV
jgi:hypothetical protein